MARLLVVILVSVALLFPGQVPGQGMGSEDTPFFILKNLGPHDPVYGWEYVKRERVKLNEYNSLLITEFERGKEFEKSEWVLLHQRPGQDAEGYIFLVVYTQRDKHWYMKKYYLLRGFLSSPEGWEEYHGHGSLVKSEIVYQPTDPRFLRVSIDDKTMGDTRVKHFALFTEGDVLP